MNKWIEFRWILPDVTVTDGPLLQFRECQPRGMEVFATEWKTAPIVVVPNSEYRAARVERVANKSQGANHG